MATKDDLDDEPLGLGGAETEGKDDTSLDDGDALDAGGADDLEVVMVDDEPAAEAADKDADAEAQGDAQDAETEGLEAGDERLSESVKQRILREVRVRKRAVEAAEGRAREVEAEIRTMFVRMLSLELSTAQMAEGKLKSDIKEAKADLIAAKEAGETTSEVDAQEKLNALQNKLREVEHLQTDLEGRVEKAKTAPSRDGVQKLRPITQEWMGRNKWFGTEKYGVATGAVKTLSAQLEREGISPDDPKHYTELDRRLHQELPSLRTRLRSESPRQANRPGPGTIVAPARQAPARGTSPNKVTLTRADLTNMRSFGMDPTNKVHLQQYARSKQEVANG